MKVLLLTAATADYKDWAAISRPNKERYCRLHGYKFESVTELPAPGVPASWSKLLLIAERLQHFDWVFWSDADSLIMNQAIPIKQAADLSRHFVCCADDDGIMSGTLFVRGSDWARRFLLEAWTLPYREKLHHPLHLGVCAAIRHLVEVFYPNAPEILVCPQREFDSRPVPAGADPRAASDGDLGAFYRPGDFILHHAGRDAKTPEMLERFAEAAAQTISIPRNRAPVRWCADARRPTETNAASLARGFVKSLPEYPAGMYVGRGIVICGGGLRYFTNAWVCINMLRSHGCSLPVQVWHLGPHEMTDEMAGLLASLGASAVDASELRRDRPARILNGWELKAYSILHSPYEEVLLLDADNVPLVDPEFLFGTAPYAQTGAVFWPDYGRLGSDRSIWRICGIGYRDEPEFETGQIVAKKEKCWTALCLALWMNEYSDFFYNHIHGDKETFHLAFHITGTPYSMPARGIEALPGTMCQHDFDGRRIFQHRNLEKWKLAGRNRRIPGFQLEDECLRFLDELASRWNGTVGAFAAFNPAKQTAPEKQCAEDLCARQWQYHRVGHDRRPMTFAPDGTVGEGSAGMERRWIISERQGLVVLDIYSEDTLTCSLTRQSGDNWTGRWLVFERMPIELIPA